MDKIRIVLEAVKEGRLTLEQAEEQLKAVGELDYASLDLEREKRTGFPEVVFAAGKTPEQLTGIVRKLMAHQEIVLATRVSAEQAAYLQTHVPEMTHEQEAGIAWWSAKPLEPVRPGYVAVVTAGTSDWRVAQEAAWTVRCFGSEVRLIADVGVAGLHRLLRRLDEIRGADVLICVAGMEGALASVLAGLVDRPVIAVPTSVGYGANFGGVSALLTMLNSCANGVTVVNIDNGFGAGYMAGMIHRLIAPEERKNKGAV